MADPPRSGPPPRRFGGIEPLSPRERLRCALRATWLLSRIADPRPVIPHRPTPPDARAAIAHALELGPDDRLVDIGCGRAAALIDLVERCGGQGVGLERDPTLAAAARAAAEGHPVRIVEGDFEDPAARERLALDEATVVLMFLLPWAVDALLPVLAAEMHPDARIASYTFAGLHRPHGRSVRVPGFAFEGHDVPLWIWRAADLVTPDPPDEPDAPAPAR